MLQKETLPIVSFIIPVHNGAATLLTCLIAALNQSYNNFELILVNNASTDHSKEIMLKLACKDPRIIYVEEPIKSRGAARNRGIEASRGEIIVMTDADCIVPFNWMSQIIEPLLSKSADVVVGNEEDSVGNYWTRLQQEANQNFVDHHICNQYIDHLDTKNFAIRKSCLLNVGLFNRSIGNLEDFELKIRLKKQGIRIWFLKNLRVRHHHSHTFRQLFLKRIDQGYWATKIFALHQEYFKQHPEAMVKSMSLMNFIAFFPWIIVYTFKNNLNRSFYELITGIAWRLGILRAHIA